MSRRTHNNNNEGEEGQLTMTVDGTFVVFRSGLNDEPKLVSFSKVALILINLLTFLGGLAVTALGAYVFVEFNTKFSGLLSEDAAIGAMVAGVILALIAGVGIYGTLHGQVSTLAVYSVVSLAILITILSVLGLFVDYINTVSQVATSNLVVMNKRQMEVNDFFASAYTKCCVQNPAFCNTLVPGAEGYCKPVHFCSDQNQTTSTNLDPCYVDYYGVTPNNPPKLVYQEFCGTLVSAGLVGFASASTGKCGYPFGAGLFFAEVFLFVNDNVQYPYICIGLVSAIIFLELVFAIIVIRHQHLVATGQYENSSARRRMNEAAATGGGTSFSSGGGGGGVKSSRGASMAVASTPPLTLGNSFRFQNDDFEADMQAGITMPSADDDGDVRTKSGRYFSSGNPIFNALRSAGSSNSKHASNASRVKEADQPQQRDSDRVSKKAADENENEDGAEQEDLF